MSKVFFSFYILIISSAIFFLFHDFEKKIDKPYIKSASIVKKNDSSETKPIQIKRKIALDNSTDSYLCRDDSIKVIDTTHNFSTKICVWEIGDSTSSIIFHNDTTLVHQYSTVGSKNIKISSGSSILFDTIINISCSSLSSDSLQIYQVSKNHTSKIPFTNHTFYLPENGVTLSFHKSDVSSKWTMDKKTNRDNISTKHFSKPGKVNVSYSPSDYCECDTTITLNFKKG